METRTSWVVATAALVVMAVAFGAPWITVVALKDIAAEVNGERSVPAFAGALVWVGSGFGGILMGRVAERVGVRWTVIGGAAMIAVGLTLSTFGPSLPLYIGHGLFIGLLGIGGINAPFYVYVSRWFDRRRGSALALISSGSFLAGAIWPPIFERTIAYAGWRHAMLYYAVTRVPPHRARCGHRLGPPPESRNTRDVRLGAGSDLKTVLGWPPNLVFVLQACAIFTCCVPMSMPQAHLVAFCSDLGISPVHGAAMLSVLLGMAFVSRQLWGALSDRVGGLYTMLAGSACQTVGLAAVSAHPERARPVYGLGAVRVRLQRSCSRQHTGVARTVSGRRSLLADPDVAVVQRHRAWRPAAGSAAFCTTISAITRRPLPPASASA